ncbi:hypothetical protein CEXT_796051 [Caerostris extrusa]|uniref:Uncharacterized protein n=1 Tax=Caerostris extrusa TaxID=172846 RepID=A0AAV4TSK2_CAEEX|nr:hypothetical protein CEXT_796051 [Caerostris extrusa]
MQSRILRSDTIKMVFQPPYEGSFQVQSRSEKVFKLLTHGRQSVVNIDRLKPVYILGKEEENTPSKTEQVLKESSQEYTTATPPVTRIIPTTKIISNGQMECTNYSQLKNIPSKEISRHAGKWQLRAKALTVTEAPTKESPLATSNRNLE